MWGGKAVTEEMLILPVIKLALLVPHTHTHNFKLNFLLCYLAEVDAAPVRGTSPEKKIDETSEQFSENKVRIKK